MDNSNYNSLQATLTARNYHGLTLTAGYTYSHALGVGSGQGTGGSSYIPINTYASLRQPVLRAHRVRHSESRDRLGDL